MEDRVLHYESCFDWPDKTIVPTGVVFGTYGCAINYRYHVLRCSRSRGDADIIVASLPLHHSTACYPFKSTLQAYILEKTDRLDSACPDDENMQLFAHDEPRLAFCTHAGSQ